MINIEAIRDMLDERDAGAETSTDQWFVDSGHANAGTGTGHGYRGKPFSTLTALLSDGKPVAGDTVRVAGRHAETIAAETEIGTALNIVGGGFGDRQPVFTFDGAAAAKFKVTAAKARLARLQFKVDQTGGDLVTMLELTKAGCWVENCLFREGDDVALAMIILSNIAADRCVIRNNVFWQETGGGDHAIAIDAVTSRLLIEKNWITGDFDDACIHSASAHTSCLIQHNALDNLATGQHAIEFSAAATGMIRHNMFKTDIVAPGGIDPGSCFMAENYHADAIDTSGILDPAAT